MPRDYGKLRHGYWTGETGRELRKLGMEAQLVGAYLCTCASSNMIGLYYLPLDLIAHETAVGTIEGASKGLRSLFEAGFAFYDEDSETVFVPNMAREQIAERLSEKDPQRRGVIALLKEHRKSRFVVDFVRIYKDAYHLPDDLVSKPLRSPFEAPSKPGEQRAGDQENSSPPAPARSNVNAKSAHDWYAVFSRRYWEKTGKQYGHGKADAVATGNFSDLLESLPTEQRAADWLARERILTEFLGRTDARTVSAGWPFSFFVTDFRALAIPPDKRPAFAGPRPALRAGSIPENWEPEERSA